MCVCVCVCVCVCMCMFGGGKGQFRVSRYATSVVELRVAMMVGQQWLTPLHGKPIGTVSVKTWFC